MFEMVSVIMPTYNSERYVLESIESILHQTYENLELIIFDDCSSDDTLAIINRKFGHDARIRLLKGDVTSGPAVARNNAVLKATGRYIAFCDSDDQWLPEKLEKQISVMRKNGYPFTFTSYRRIDENGRNLGVVGCKTRINYNEMLRTNYIGCLTAVYDSKKLGKVLMPEIWKRQDWGLWLKILRGNITAHGIQEVLAICRVRSGSISSSKIRLFKYSWIIFYKVEKLGFFVSSIRFFAHVFFVLEKKINENGRK